MGCDHPSFVPIGPLVSELWYFEYFTTWRPSAILNLKKKLIFDHVTVIICCCVPNFNKIGSRVRPPDAHHCWMYNAPLLGNAFATVTASWGTCRGHDRMRPPKFHPNRSIDYRQIIAFPTFCNMAFVCHLEWQTDAIRILLFWTTHEVNYVVRLPCQNLVSIRFPRRRYYNCIILPFWLENA